MAHFGDRTAKIWPLEVFRPQEGTPAVTCVIGNGMTHLGHLGYKGGWVLGRAGSGRGLECE